MWEASSGMKIRNTLVIFLIGMLTCVPLRIYQILTLSDYSGAGAGSSWQSWLLTAVMCICAVTMLAMSLSSREFPQFSPKKKSALMGIISILTAVAVGYSCALELKELFAGVSGSTQNSANYAAIIANTLGVVCVITFLFLAASFFRADNLLESSPALMVLPILWMGLKLVLAFLESMTIGGIAERKFDILTMVFFLLYFISFGKFMSGAAENSAKWSFAAGAPAALFALCTVIPRYVLLFAVSFGEVSMEIDASYVPELADLFLGVFALGSLFYISARQPVRRAAPAPRREQPVRPMEPAIAGIPSTARYSPPVSRMNAYQSRPASYAPSTAYGSNNYDVSHFGAVRYDAPYADTVAPSAAYGNPAAGAQVSSGSADTLTSQGAGMRVADDFSLRPDSSRHGGLGDFRSNIRGGRRALDVLESSGSRSLPGFKPLLVNAQEPQEEPVEKVIAEQKEQMDSLNEEVGVSLSSLLGSNPNAPEVVASVEAAPDEASFEAPEPEVPEIPEVQTPDYPPAPRSVRLGTGLADKIADQVPAAPIPEEPQLRVEVPAQPAMGGGAYNEQGGYFDAYTNSYGMYPSDGGQYDNGYDTYADDGYGEYGEYEGDGYDYEYEYLAPGAPGYGEFDNGYDNGYGQPSYQGEYYDPYGNGYNNGYEGEYYGEDEYYAEEYTEDYAEGYDEGYDSYGGYDQYQSDQGYYEQGYDQYPPQYDPYGGGY